MKYTGINKIFKIQSAEKYRDIASEHVFSDFLSDWKWILSFTKGHKRNVMLYTFVALLCSTLSLGSAYFTSRLINTVSQKQVDRLAFYICSIAGMTVLLLLCNVVKSRVYKVIEQGLITDIQTNLFRNILDIGWTEFRKYKSGDLLHRFNNDMVTVIDNAVSWIPGFIINIYTFVITVVVLFRMDPVMACICLVSAPFLFLMSRKILYKQKEYREKISAVESDMLSFEADSFNNMDTVKAFGAGGVLSYRLSVLQKKYSHYNMDYNKFGIITEIKLKLINTAVTFGTLGYCLYGLWTGGILFGDMTFFINQRSALSSLFNSIVSTVPNMIDASVSAHRLREFINLPKESHDYVAYNVLRSASDKGLFLETRGLTFDYSDGQQVYNSVNFSVGPGEVVAILSESGGGKTTLFRLLLGLVLPEEGQVVIKDADGNEVGMNADLRKFVSYVPQGNTLMMGTIADNMRLINESATDDEIISALKIACAWEFVEKTGGINAVLGEHGNGISEGQAQRICIARAILRNAPILLFDEATSALDEETEAKVMENVLSVSKGKAVVIATHRLSVLKKCNRVYKITDKKIETVDKNENSTR